MPGTPPARRGSPRALAACAILALAAAAPAEAQRKEPRAAPAAASPSRTAPAAAPRSLPPPAAAPLPAEPAAQPARAGWLSLGAGGWAGLDAGSSAALSLDYALERTPPSWRRLGLEYHVGVLLARPTRDVDLTRTSPQPYGPPLEVAAGSETTEAWVVELAASARVRIAWEKFALFAEGGAGVAQTLERVEREETFEGRTTTTENVTGLVLRLGAGMSFDLGARTRLVLQPFALSLQLGPSYSAFAPSLGLSYRM